MSTYSEADLGWTAGILDGEGYLGAIFGDSRLSVRVSVTSTSYAMLSKLQTLWGGYIHNGSERKEKRKATYYWSIGGRTAKPMLEAVLPYMVVKAEQAELIIEFASTLGRSNERVSWATLDIRERCAERLFVLNRRGV